MTTAQRHYAPGTWQGPRTPPTVLFRMAMEAERQREVAARIRDLRGPRPQRVIADLVGVTLRAYQAWEAGGGINWDNVQQLAEALGVTEEYLLYGRDAQAEPDPSQLDRIEAKLDRLIEAAAMLSQLEERLRLLEAEELAREAEELARSEATSTSMARPPRQQRR
jgi:transcriptional regulator with XRE-family HTH domain